MFCFDNLKGSKALALLLDPDKTVIDHKWLSLIKKSNPDLILIGGSQPFPYDLLDNMVSTLKENLLIPIIGFPGAVEQIHPKYDALLALSIIQSTNSQYILEPLFQVAPLVNEWNLLSFYTPYLLLGNTGNTAVERVLKKEILPIYDSNTLLPFLFGLKIMKPICLYLEAGSGSEQVLNSHYVVDTKKVLPQSYLFAGGGVRRVEQAKDLWQAGTDCLVVGNWIEEDPNALLELTDLRDFLNSSVN